MIKKYASLSDLIDDNRSFFDKDFLGKYFFASLKFFKENSGFSYALMAYEGDKKLFASKAGSYDLIISGDIELVPELIRYIVSNNYEFYPFICSADSGKVIKEILFSDYGIRVDETLSMVIMESDELTENIQHAEIPSDADAGKITEFLELFYDECGLISKPDDIEAVRGNLSNYRIIRDNGDIVSMCELSGKYITHVYTSSERRGEGFAKNLVSQAKNELISAFGSAVLNCDADNKKVVSFYKSLGFRQVFSRSEFTVID